MFMINVKYLSIHPWSRHRQCSPLTDLRPLVYINKKWNLNFDWYKIIFNRNMELRLDFDDEFYIYLDKQHYWFDKITSKMDFLSGGRVLFLQIMVLNKKSWFSFDMWMFSWRPGWEKVLNNCVCVGGYFFGFSDT